MALGQQPLEPMRNAFEKHGTPFCPIAVKYVRHSKDNMDTRDTGPQARDKFFQGSNEGADDFYFSENGGFPNYVQIPLVVLAFPTSGHPFIAKALWD